MSKSKDALAAKSVLDYLVKQNRPYSAVDVFNNLHKEYGKTAVVKVLETLAQEGKIKEKIYGKQKVYVADQSQFAVVDDKELQGMDDAIVKLTENYKQTSESVRILESELRGLTSAISTESATVQLQELQAECIKYEKRLESLRGQTNLISTEERDSIITSRTSYAKEWRKRKRLTGDILNAILEGYPKPKKHLYEEIGIETDEEFKVTPPDVS